MISITTKKKIEEDSADKKIYRCTCCGKEYDRPLQHFYKSQWSKMYEDNDKYCPICISCLKKKFEEYTKRYNESIAMMIICHYLDIPFYYSLYDSITKKNDTFNIGMYLRQMNNRQYQYKTFVNTLIDKKELGITSESFEEIKEEKWSAADSKNKKNTVEIIGYDPFEGYSENDRRFLFNDLIKYLDEDGIEDDQFKISQIIQLVNNNFQIRQYNLAISKLDPQIDAKDIKELTGMKKSLIDGNDKIAKENGISVKNRLNHEAGRSTLTYLMKHMREINIPEAEANYYTQLKSEGTQWAANMSLKAIKENGFFDENDYKDILGIQYEKIQDLQGKLDSIEEENRLLLIENDELKSIDKAGDSNG